MSRYQFIEQAADTEPVQVLCRVLHVSSAGYISVAHPTSQARSRLAISSYYRF